METLLYSKRMKWLDMAGEAMKLLRQLAADVRAIRVLLEESKSDG
jgi:hypothetical protein